ncbi:hypothetical protein B0J18DRAFT_434135 [Chaetomium sp. MPI-SDFR-AT-0129]|nr:hypothetical protein B0J18DRAFT_434135 [Chaetomium sp. MPI-SDFR-AT-0129]
MANFLKAKGPAAGAKLPLFYGAYVYFEKLRVKEGKPKSKHRLGMEEEWGRNGMELSYDQRTPLICLRGEKPHVSKYGKLSIF